MKILQICHRVPYPPIDGGNIAMMNMALALIESGNELHQFALNTSRHFVETSTVPADLQSKLNLSSSAIDTNIKIHSLIANLFTNESYNIVRFYSKSAEEHLKELLKQTAFDIVQLETLYTTPYIECIRKNSHAKIVLRAHNAEHIIWQRLVHKEKNPFRKNYIRLLASRLRTYEIETLQKIDALIPITDVDESIFHRLHYRGPVLTVPVSLDLNDYQVNDNDKLELCLFHLGSMDWMPNLEAVEWFLKECWPTVHAQHPGLKLYLAGRSFPDSIIRANHPNVICEGRIEDAHSYMEKKQIMIVPLHSGSGMRVKIIQGMALGKTIISTSIGAEGIPVTPDKNILIADTPDQFISAVNRCIDDYEFCMQTGRQARKFAEDHYSNAAVGKQLSLFYRALLRIRKN